MWVGKFCSFLAPSGLAQRWDLGGEKGVLIQGPQGFSLVAEWIRDHSMASGPRRMSRTGKRVTGVGHGEGKAPGASHWGDRSVLRTPKKA